MTSVLILLSGFDPGTYFIEDDGIPNNGIAQLRGPDGSVIFFNIPTEFLTVTASAGRSIVFNLTESFGAADINVGNLTNAAENPDSISVKTIAGAGDVLLVSNGSILESGADAAADVTANTLILSAATGIGTASLALETQVGTLEAETTTGGINLRNYGNLIIGGLTDDVVGLDVDTSGNLTLVNFGSITLSEQSPGGLESVHGGTTSGNVTLTANGFDADITSNVDQDSIAAAGGNITLTAGRDVSFGTQGLNFDNDVRARGTLTINTGRDLNVDGFADLASDGFGAATGGDVIVNAGRDINVLNATGTDGSIGAEGSAGANVILNTGPGGFVRLLATSTSTLFSSTGDVEVNADRMVLSAVAGITASGGQVSIRPVTEGWNIDLGSVTDGAFALEISDAELDRIFTPSLFIGNATSGTVTVSSGISPAAALAMTLRSNTDIFINASMTITNALTLFAGDNIFQLGASAITAGGLNAFVDQEGNDGGVGGIATFNGAIIADPNAINGNGEDDTLSGSAENNILNGNDGADTLNGFGGNDTMNGGTGDDEMIGGLGDDDYIVDSALDVIVEAVGEGFDEVTSSVSYALDPNVEKLTLTGVANLSGTGNSLDNTIIGNSGENVLNGGVGADTLAGGLGDDTYLVDNVADVVTEAAAAGTDLVNSTAATHTLGANVENLTLLGGAAIDGTGNGLANILNGNDSDNELNGLGAVDTLNGFDGNDRLDGGTSADVMAGGLGNDTYVVDVAGDSLIEAAAAGTDTVESVIGFTLAANFENLTLIGVAAINGTGNAVANVLTGNNAANTLNGLAGADTMIGLDGNDIYVVDSAADDVVEAAAQGNDLVQTTVTYTLSANVERLALLGAAAINGTGNSLANDLDGNDAANTLNGGTGVDNMAGAGGDDTYIVDNNADVIFESPGDGTDQVNSSVNYTLGSNVENLTITGAAAASGTGNLGANVITGNGNINTLNGGGGTDTLIGLGGNDIYIIDDVSDSVVEAAAAGTDVVRTTVTYTLTANVENLTLLGGAAIDGTGNSLDNTLTGNAAANILNGGTGADTMIGGSGSDTYIVDNNADVVIENAAGGIADQVNSSVNFTLDSNAENLTITGAAAASGTGNSVANVIIGNGNINTLKGEGGIDTIDGGGGNDNIYGGTGDDVLTGGAGGDKFVFDTALNAATNVDDILDYVVADDTILLDRTIFTGIAANGTLAAAAFRAGTVAVDADDRIIFDSATGNIFYDVDGVGGTAQVLFATVDPGLALTNADFSAFI